MCPIPVQFLIALRWAEPRTPGDRSDADASAPLPRPGRAQRLQEDRPRRSIEAQLPRQHTADPSTQVGKEPSSPFLFPTRVHGNVRCIGSGGAAVSLPHPRGCLGAGTSCWEHPAPEQHLFLFPIVFLASKLLLHFSNATPLPLPPTPAGTSSCPSPQAQQAAETARRSPRARPSSPTVPSTPSISAPAPAPAPACPLQQDNLLTSHLMAR